MAFQTDHMITQKEARETCKAMGGDIPVISDFEADGDMIEKAHQSKFTSFWVGLYYLQADATYRWRDDSTFTHHSKVKDTQNQWIMDKDHCFRLQIGQFRKYYRWMCNGRSKNGVCQIESKQI